MGPLVLPHLITFPISHYCERARWALDILSQATGKKTYVEESHAPPFHKRPVRAAGGKQQVPVLALPPSEDEGFVEPSPTSSGAIIAYADARLPPDQRLYPHEDSEAVLRTGELERLFDEKLGTAIRTFCYGHLLDAPNAKDMLYVCMTDGIESGFEKAVAYVAVQSRTLLNMMRRGFDITPEKIAAAKKTIEEVFAQIADLLAKNGGYLVQANRFTAADLTFAALAAPLFTNIPNYAYGITSRLGALPKEMDEAAAPLRDTPAGKFVQRMYEQHRPTCGLGAGTDRPACCG